ncbi:MAG: hypothetical protein QW594_01210 [Candidatus Woesearchaeota archaeon]
MNKTMRRCVLPPSSQHRACERKHPLLSSGNTCLLLHCSWSPDGPGPPSAFQARTPVAFLMLAA